MLLVQTSPVLDSELRVMESLLSSDILSRPETGPGLSVMLVAGTRGTSVHQTAETFRPLPVVECVLELDIGRLRTPRRRRTELPRKVIDRLMVVRRIREMTPAVRAFAPTVVLSPQDRLDVAVASRLARSLGVPQVIHLHYPCGPWLGREVLARLRKADRVFTVSEFIRDNAIKAGADPARTVVLRNTLPRSAVPALTATERAAVRQQLGLSPASVLVLMAGRLAPWKGQEDLVRAMLPVLRERENVHLMLIGSEVPHGTGVTVRIRDLIDEDPAGRRVHVGGERPHHEVLRLLQAADIFGHPSRGEAGSVSVLEAMSAGLPVVAWDEGGSREQVVHGETGLLAPTGNIGALSEGLDALTSDAAIRRRFGRAGQHRMETFFNPEVVAPSLPLLLAQVASERQSAGKVMVSGPG